MWSGTVARFVDLGNGLRNTVLRGFQKNGFVLPPQELAFGSAWQKALDEVQKLLTPLRSELADCTIILEGWMPTNPNRRGDFILGTRARRAVVVLELRSLRPRNPPGEGYA